MSQDYRVNVPGGVKIEATGQLIYPGDPEWPAYEAWPLADQPGPDFPGGPVPPGTGLLPYVYPVVTLAQQRTEMLSRLDAMVLLRRGLGTVNILAHTWALTDAFLLALAIHSAAFPPVPPGFTLPDATRAQVPLNLVQFRSLVNAVSHRLVLVNNVYAAFVTAINASATPLSIDLDAGSPA